ncbi:MAG: hypothetical protein ABSF46_15145 [Terriglobia bacterium]
MSDKKSTRRTETVVRASRPQWRERPAPARGQDARATAGETPALPPQAAATLPDVRSGPM